MCGTQPHAISNSWNLIEAGQYSSYMYMFMYVHQRSAKVGTSVPLGVTYITVGGPCWSPQVTVVIVMFPSFLAVSPEHWQRSLSLVEHGCSQEMNPLLAPSRYDWIPYIMLNTESQRRIKLSRLSALSRLTNTWKPSAAGVLAAKRVKSGLLPILLCLLWECLVIKQ